ncbi:MAG: carboxypeptidase-like regulatory domain-containing protein [Gemmatimonadota bacterium]|nr:carboxypeptidase-like regulatory domain-containing protein [Gemmatimonadota bacterium]
MRITGLCTIAYVAASFLSAAGSAHAQEQRRAASALTGIVVDTLDAPVAFAQVSVVAGSHQSTADEDGRFRVRGLLAQKTLFEVRRIGYNPTYFEINLPDEATVEVRIRLRETPRDLAPVEVSDVRDPLRRVGFYERLATGHGYFLTPEMIQRTRPARATDALLNIPNVVVVRRGYRTRVLTANHRCEYALVVDKVLVGEPGSRVRTASPDDAVSASDLYAVEVYPRNRGVPPQFLGLSHEDGCGTIIIWTKGMIAR